MSKKKPLNYAVIGLGRAGWNIHVKQLRDREDAKIVAVVDPEPSRREQALAELGARGYETIDALLKDARDVDVVVVATPSFLHGPDSKKALKAGKHVVVEKPMAMSVAEADSMIRAAKAARKKLFVHQNYRFNPSFTFLEDLVASGRLGKLFHLRYTSHGFSRRNDWQTLSKNGGGVLNNTCPHFIDQLLQLVGAPIVKVFGDLRQIASAGDVEDHTKALMRAKNGCTIDMEISSAIADTSTPASWLLCGEYGTLTVTGKEATIKWFDPKKLPKLAAQDGPASDRKYGNTDQIPWQEEKVDFVGPDKGNFYDNVFAVLRDKGKMRITPESVREVIRVIAEIRKGTDFSGKPKAPAKKAVAKKAATKKGAGRKAATKKKSVKK